MPDIRFPVGTPECRRFFTGRNWNELWATPAVIQQIQAELDAEKGAQQVRLGPSA